MGLLVDKVSFSKYSFFPSYIKYYNFKDRHGHSITSHLRFSFTPLELLQIYQVCQATKLTMSFQFRQGVEVTFA